MICQLSSLDAMPLAAITDSVIYKLLLLLGFYHSDRKQSGTLGKYSSATTIALGAK